MTQVTPAMIARLVVLNETVAKAEAEAKAIKKLMIDGGAASYTGNGFEATVSFHERANLDMKAVREKLSPQFIAAHTTMTPVYTVKVKAIVEIAA